MRYIKSYPNDAAIQGAVNDNLLGHPYVALDDELHKIDWDGKRINYSMKYLTVEALEDGNFYVRNENFDYSLNGGEWTTGIGHQTITLSSGDTVRFKHLTNTSYPGMFSGNTMSFNVYGNIESMEYGDNFSGVTSVKLTSAFTSYFSGSTGLVSAEHLELPAEEVPENCYKQMFKGCTSLTTSPELNADTVKSGGYNSLFYGCSSLNYIKCTGENFTMDSLSSWVEGVSATGTFVKKSNVYWPTGVFGIPSGWTVVGV